MSDSNEQDQFCNVGSIHGFLNLFVPAASGEKTARIRFGSTLLISGPPGAGKTTFALAMVRAMMAEAKREKRDEKTMAYYVSSEVDENKLKANFDAFGWFLTVDDKAKGDESFKFQIDSPVPDETNFYAITPMPEVDRPVPSPEELVNGIFNRIAHTLLPSESPTEHAKIYVVVDSITALLKGCANAGEERRQTHEILRRLEDRFGKDHLALTVLLAEQNYRSEQTEAASIASSPNEPSVEDYLADIVFRLYVRSLPLGRRSRILEVVKSQGVNMILGEHTWQIVSNDHSGDILRLKEFRNYIKNLCRHCDKETSDSKQQKHEKGASASGEAAGLIGTASEEVGNAGTKEDQLKILKDTSEAAFVKETDVDVRQGEVAALEEAKTRWGGVVIFPRPRLQINFESSDRTNGGSSLGTGTQGLDLNVKPGTITLITGPISCGKTPLCKQFLEHEASDTDKSSRVLISFDVPSELNAGEEKFTRLHFTQSQFDLNVLVAHIEWILQQGCERMAFDGLSEWITMFDKPEAARVLEALMLTVRRPREKSRASDGQPVRMSPPAVFMTYEMALDDDPLAPAVLGTAADNLIVVRQVPINDELRQVIYVLKPRPPEEGLTHRHPGELVRTGEGKERRLSVNHTSLEAYTGLLNASREVQPARVLIQLFAENDAEEKFNKEQVRRLENQYARRASLTSTTFGLSEIGSTLDMAFGAAKPGEAFNLAIHSVDEWWLKAQNTGKFLRDLKLQETASAPKYSDFWWFEVEKALGRLPAGEENTHQPWHAIPGYLNFGMFCINLDALDEAPVSQHDQPSPESLKNRGLAGRYAQFQRDRWQRLLKEVPRLWARKSKDEDWFEIGSSEEPTVLSYALKATNQEARENLRRKAVFTFDSSTRETCACMFFELAWAFGASESFLASANKSIEQQAAKRALLFLQFMVMEGLMPARCSSHSQNHGGQAILFSRHWYSTLQQQPKNETPTLSSHPTNESEKTGTWPPGGLVALPFMPTGSASTEDAISGLLNDIAVRQYYWVDRMFRYSKRFASKDESGKALVEELRKTSDELLKEESLEKKLTMVLEAYSLSRKWLLKMVGQSNPPKSSGKLGNIEWTADLDDLIELASWAAFRLRLLFGQNHGRFPDKATASSKDPAAQAIYEARWVRHSLPDLDAKLAATFDVENVIATGYVCSGSWMYGVGNDSRSSEIQAQVLAELTSLESAKDRAKSGAGIPARKDFFYLYGEQPVKGMEYLNWRELLRYGGSRSRQRDRVLVRPPSSGGVEESNVREPPQALDDPGPLYGIIQHELLSCLRIADLHRENYAKGSLQVRSAAKLEVSKVAQQAIDRIFDVAWGRINPTARA